MVTVKFSKEEYKRLQEFLLEKENDKLLSTLNETYYGNPKRTLEERDNFSKKIFDAYREEKRVKDHNKVLDEVKCSVIKAVNAGASLAALPFSERDLQAYMDCKETLLQSGFNKDSIVIRKAGFMDRWKLKTDKSHLIIINFA